GGAPRRHRGRHAGRVDLRPRPDGSERGAVCRPARPVPGERERGVVVSDPVFLGTPRRLVDLEVDGRTVRVPEGSTILDACRAEGVDTPTLCFLDTLTPVNACRVCVVEVEGARALVPACSRQAEA